MSGMSEPRFSIDREIHEGYERLPDPLRHPAAEMGESAKALGNEIRLKYRDAIRTALREPEYTEAFRERVLSSEFDLPPVEVLENPEQIRAFLQEYGFWTSARDMFRDESLLVLRLPDPMNLPYRWDAALDSDQEQWNRLCLQARDAIYDAIAAFRAEHDVDVFRLNTIGVHQAQEKHRGYYYLFRVAPPGRNGGYAEYPEDHIESRMPERDEERPEDDIEGAAVEEDEAA